MRLSDLMGLLRRNALFILGASALLTFITIYLAILWAPTARFFTAPNAQRIFYFHVPAAWVTYLSFGVLSLCSGAYLKTENPRFDIYARAAAELTLIFATVTLLSGTLWMRAEWVDSNAEIVDRFLWDTRLAITMVMWLILASYLVLRKAAPVQEAARLGGVLGVFGFIAVPLSFLSARLLKSNHPNPIASSEGSIEGSMIMTMNLGLLAFSLLFIYLMLFRTRLLTYEEQVMGLREMELENS